MDRLTPELERRLQVEELWARRNVLADSINSERKQRFLAQYAAANQFKSTVKERLGSRQRTAGADVEVQRRPAENSSRHGSPPVAPYRKFDGWRTALFIGLALTTVTALAFAPIQRISSSMATESAGRELPMERVLSAALQKPKNDSGEKTPRHTTAIPDLRSEVAAEMLTTSQRDSRGPETSQ